MMTEITSNVHPPLYYFILKVFMHFLNPANNVEISIYITKFVSTIPLMLIAILSFTKIKKQWGFNVAAVFTILTSFLSQFNSVRESYWIDPITLSNVGDYFQFIFSPSTNAIGTLLGLILFICLVYLIYINLKNKKDHVLLC